MYNSFFIFLDTESSNIVQAVDMELFADNLDDTLQTGKYINKCHLKLVIKISVNYFKHFLSLSSLFFVYSSIFAKFFNLFLQYSHKIFYFFISERRNSITRRRFRNVNSSRRQSSRTREENVSRRDSGIKFFQF